MSPKNVGVGRGNGIRVQSYVDQILRPPPHHIVPFFVCQNSLMFQYNIAPSYMVRVVIDFMHQYNSRTMLWLGPRLGLNPIDHLWDESQR